MRKAKSANHYKKMALFCFFRADKATSAKWRTWWYDKFDVACGMADTLR